jgi:hypothetical protein
MPEITDQQVITAMVENGGGFVSALGRAAHKADAINLHRIKHAFPEYWASYAAIAETMQERKDIETKKLHGHEY